MSYTDKEVAEIRRGEALRALARDGEAHRVTDHFDALLVQFGQACRAGGLSEVINARNFVNAYVAGLEAVAYATVAPTHDATRGAYCNHPHHIGGSWVHMDGEVCHRMPVAPDLPPDLADAREPHPMEKPCRGATCDLMPGHAGACQQWTRACRMTPAEDRRLTTDVAHMLEMSPADVAHMLEMSPADAERLETLWWKERMRTIARDIAEERASMHGHGYDETADDTDEEDADDDA